MCTRKRKAFLFLSIFLASIVLTSCKISHLGFFYPKGIIAYQERKLFFDTLALMLIVVLPVIIMSLAFVHHYRVSQHTKDYKPHWGHNLFLEILWWGIPFVIIFILSFLTWKKSNELDPYHKITQTNQKALLIQAIALPWKWLFIYPEENIASVNVLVIPTARPVEYWITADNVPMSAFFIPQLGSQLYAMAGMRTRLYLIADKAGTYQGVNSQYNGSGFSDMFFTVQAMAPQKMVQWMNNIKRNSQPLTEPTYQQLLIPSIKNKPIFYSGVEKNLFMKAMNVYMTTYGNVHPREKRGNHA